MFRVSFIVLALASALALNGCSQCSNPSTETAPAVPVEATPAADAVVAPAPVDGTAPVAPTDAAATPAPAAH